MSWRTPAHDRFALALCVAACEASTTPTASSTKAPGTEGTALQALVAKTKKNLVFLEGGTFQMGDFGMVHDAAKLPYYDVWFGSALLLFMACGFFIIGLTVLITALPQAPRPMRNTRRKSRSVLPPNT